MSIKRISALMPPPSSPSEVPASNGWADVEKRLGTVLPDDYKEFVQLYGTGEIDNFLWVFNPFSKNENVNLLDQVRIQLSALTELQGYGEHIPYALFPEQGGILPFAVTDNGDVLFWQTIGAPNNWTVLVNEARSPEWEAFDVSMSEFLLGILVRGLSCTIFPKAFPSAAPVFESGG